MIRVIRILMFASLFCGGFGITFSDARALGQSQAPPAPSDRHIRTTTPATAHKPPEYPMGDAASAPDWWRRESHLAADARMIDKPVPDEHQTFAVLGRLSVSPAEADKDLRATLTAAVQRWLEPDVAPGWTPPPVLLDTLARDRYLTVSEQENPLYRQDVPKMYAAGALLDFSSSQREKLIKAFHNDESRLRLFHLGGGLTFVLVCLAAVLTYIRTDETTMGYYTNRLRLLAAAGVGAAGATLYQIFS